MNQRRIIIVEDENIVALDIQKQLEKNGYVVPGVFTTGERVLEAAELDSADLILMDIKLAGKMDGIQTATLIRQKRDIPVVMLTAFADERTLAQVKQAEPYGYVIKPFEERELRTAIEMAFVRIRLETRLKESEERYRRFFEDDLSADFIADGEGRLLECNGAFARIFGPGPEAPEERRIASLFPDAETWEIFRQRLFDRKKLESEELTLVGKAAKPLRILGNFVVGLSQDEAIVEIKGYLSDITERENLREQLRHSQKMEAMGRLSGGIAHDFNNILTVVTGYSDLILATVEPDSPIRKDIEGIKNAAYRAVKLTRQLLTFSRRQVLQPRQTDINALVTDLEKLIRRLVPEEISLRISAAARPSTTFVDPNQIEQAVINLAVNARDSMKNGGYLTIHAGNVEYGGALVSVMGEIPPGRYVVIGVRDTGSGIPLDLRDKIFEPFFTTKLEGEGTGLGLSLVYGIVQQSNGYILLDTMEGKGSEFRILLPVREEGEAVEVAREPAETIESGGGETILVVEDEDPVRNLMLRILEAKGYNLLDARNAGEAILAFEERQGRIDLLITDVVMPQYSGIRLAGRLSAINPELKIIFISGYPAREMEPEYGQDLKFSSIAKPFQASDFVRIVRETLDGRTSSI